MKSIDFHDLTHNSSYLVNSSSVLAFSSLPVLIWIKVLGCNNLTWVWEFSYWIERLLKSCRYVDIVEVGTGFWRVGSSVLHLHARCSTRGVKFRKNYRVSPLLLEMKVSTPSVWLNGFDTCFLYISCLNPGGEGPLRFSYLLSTR